MRKQDYERTALEVASQVRAVEDSIDAAFFEIAELQQRMLRARSVTGVSIATGHAALEGVAASLSALVTARSGMVDWHAALRVAQQKVPGLRTTAFGDTHDCPDKASTPLRIVG